MRPRMSSPLCHSLYSASPGRGPRSRSASPCSVQPSFQLHDIYSKPGSVQIYLLRLVLSHQEVTQDVFRDRETALQLVRPRRIELDLRNYIVAFRVPPERVREPAPPPWPHIDDLAAARRNGAG